MRAPRTKRFLGLAIASLAAMALAVPAALAPLSGCGDGTGLAIATLGVSAVVGTAASGKPIDGIVTVKDRNGAVVTATTDPVTGTFTADVTGLQAPFLLRVEGAVQGPLPVALFSVGSAAGIVNVHPFTDLIVKSYFEAQGESLTTEFDRATGPRLVPAPAEIRTIAQVVRRIIGRWLTLAGLDAATFDLISTTFTAEPGDPFDAILDLTVVTDDGRVVITDGTTTQNASVTADQTASSVSVTSTTTSGGQTSTISDSVSFAPPGSQEDVRQAVDDLVATLFVPFAQVLNSKGPNLIGADLLDFHDPTFLDGGRTRQENADNLASEMKGKTFELLDVERITSFDHVNKDRIALIFTLKVFDQGVFAELFKVRSEDGSGFPFKRGTDGKWRIIGNQQIAIVEVRPRLDVRYEDQQSPTAPTVVSNVIEVAVQARAGVLSSATVTGLFPPTPTPQIVDLTKKELDRGFERFTPPGPQHIAVSEFPTAGSVYTFEMTVSATGAIVTQTAVTLSTTDEVVNITRYASGSSPSEDRAVFKEAFPPRGGTDVSTLLGKPFTVEWELPKTYGLERLEISLGLQTASATEQPIKSGQIAVTRTAHTFSLPTAAQLGGTLKTINVFVFMGGENREAIGIGDTIGTLN